MRRQVRAVAVQPQWRASDFYSASRFERWLRAQLELSRPHLSRELPNLVVLTELNGLPLLLRGGQLAALSGRFSWAAALMFTLHLPAALPIMLRERVSPIRALGLAQRGQHRHLPTRVSAPGPRVRLIPGLQLGSYRAVCSAGATASARRLSP